MTKIKEQLTPYKIKEYKAELKKQGLSKATIKRKLASLRKFFDWAEQQGITHFNAEPLLSSIDIEEEKEFGETSFKPDQYYQLVQKLQLAEQTLKDQGGIVNQIKYLSVKTKFNTYKTWYSLKQGIYNFYYKLRHQRPEWYQKYHDWELAQYLNIAILIIFAVALGIFSYQQFIKESRLTQAYPQATDPTVPNRYLSFQGRLTDSSENPITADTDMRFIIYNDETASASAKLWEEHQVVEPDQDGIFSTLLGENNPIPSSLFTENPELWLGVTVETDPEMTPRQQIATVGYAMNAETLQGFPPSASASANQIPVLTQEGDLVLAEANPMVYSSSGTFGIKGQAITISTDVGTNGDISLAPDGTGAINMNLGVDTGRAVNIQGGANLGTSGNQEDNTLIYGYAGSSNQNYDLLKLEDQNRIQFSVDAIGATHIANNLDVDGAATISGTLKLEDQLQLGNFASNPTAMGEGSLVYNTTDDKVYYYNGSDWAEVGSGSGDSYWQLNNQAIAPTNTTYDTLFGDTATASAIARIPGLSGEDVWFDTGGNFGIGTTSPGWELDVSGSMRVSGSYSFIDTQLYFGNNSSSPGITKTNGQLNIFGDPGDNQFVFTTRTNRLSNHDHPLRTNPTIYVQSATDPDTNNTEWGSLSFQGTGTGDGYFDLTTGVGDLALQPSGNVGIGTTGPNAALDVSGDIKWQDQFLLTKANNTYPTIKNTTSGDHMNFRLQTADRDGTDNLFINFDVVGEPGDANREAFIYGYDAGNSIYKIAPYASGTGSYHPLDFQIPYGTSVMRLDTDGNVGISTTSPNYKLEVDGNIGITSGNDLYIGSTYLNESTSSTDSGAYLVGAYDEFINTNETNVQGVLDDLDDVIDQLNQGTAGLWLDGDPNDYVYPNSSFSSNIYLDTGNLGVGYDPSSLSSGTVAAFNGNVGIGTTGSNFKLDIYQATSGTLGMNVETGNDGHAIGKFEGYHSGRIRLGSKESTSGERNFEFTSRDDSFQFGSMADNWGSYVNQDIMVLKAKGNVGIGTTDPLGLLNVEGAATGKALAILNETGDQDILTASSSGTPRFTIANNGDINTSNQTIDWTLNNATDALNFDGDTLSIDASNNNVGIGSNSPGNTLDVDGGIDSDTLNTGHGDNELYAMDQDVQTTDDVTFNTVNTGHGANELYAMDQDVQTTDNVQFSDITSTGTLSVNTIRDYSGGTLSLQDDAGNVGVGTTSTSHLLEVDGNIGITTGNDLYIGTTSLGETTGSTDSGAYLIGAFDEFDNTNETNVQGVLDDLDDEISNLGAGSSGLWISGTYGTYESNAPVIVGTDTAFTHIGSAGVGDLKVESDLEVLGTTYLGGASDYLNVSSSGDISLYGNADTIDLSNITGTELDITGGNVGISTTATSATLDVDGTGQFTGNLDADNGLDVTGSSLTVGGTNATVTTAGVITGTQVNADNLRMDANTLSSTSGDITIDAAGGDITIGASDNIVLGSQADATNEAVRADRTLTAGNGFTSGSGGNLTDNRTFTIGEGDGITVNTNDVAVDVTDILGTGLTESSNNIDVDETYNFSWSGTHSYSAADINYTNGTSTTFDTTGDLIINADGGDIQFADGGTNFATFTNTSSDLTVDIDGGQLLFADGDTFNIGGVSDLAYNAISDSGTTSHATNITSDNDLYVEGNAEVDGTLFIDGNLVAQGTIAGWWQRQSQALSPYHITDDLLLGDTATASALARIPGTSGEDVWFDTGANFGIGTTSPSSTLEVDGNIEITNLYDNDQSNFFDGTGNNGDTLTSISSDGTLNFTDINHDSITGVSYNDHHGVGIGIRWDGSNDVAFNASDVTDTLSNDGISSDASENLIVNAQDGLDANDSGLLVDVTDILGTGLTESSNNIDVDETYNFSWSGTHAYSAADINFTNATSTTLDTTGDLIINADGGDIQLADGGTNFATFTNTSSDLTVDIDGGQLLFADGDTFNIGGVSGLAYNAISDSGGSTSHDLDSDDDLYIQGSAEVDGTMYVDGNLVAEGTIAGWWQRQSQALSPYHITDDLLLGDTATASALARIPGTSGEDAWFNTGGNVGIGTTNPEEQLNLYGANNVLNIENTSTGGGDGGVLRFGHDQSGSTLPIGEIRAELTNGGGAGSRAGDISFWTSNAGTLDEAMRIDQTGSVGINSTSPGYTLDVDGTGRFTGNLNANNGLDVTNASLTVGGTNATISTTGVITGTQVNADNLRMDGNTISSTTGDITLDATDDIYLGVTDNIYLGSQADASNEAVRADRSLTAGDGMTGGGDLTADRTFNVVGGDGITANADDIEIDETYNFAWTGTHSYSAADINLTNATSTTLDTTGTLLFDADGNIGIDTTSPNAELDISGGPTDQIDGVDDATILDDLQVGGTIYGNLYGGMTLAGDLDMNGYEIIDTTRAYVQIGDSTNSENLYTYDGYIAAFNDGGTAAITDDGDIYAEDDIFTTDRLYFGATDTELYRNAANVLRTPDSFIVDTSIGIGSTSPAAALDINSNTTITAAGAITGTQLNIDNLQLDGNTFSSTTGDITIDAAGGDITIGSSDNIILGSQANATNEAVRADRTLTAGNGFTSGSGGDLTADRTFTIGAGSGITVNTNDVAVDQTYNFGWSGTHSYSAADIDFTHGTLTTFDVSADLNLDTVGNVGIGSTSPANDLDVNGGIDADTLNTGHGDNELYAMNQDVQTTDAVTFNGITNTSTLDNQGAISNSTGTLQLNDDLDITGLISDSDSNLQINDVLEVNTIRDYSGGILALQDDSGQVGIGTSTPVGKLEVEGSIDGKALTILNELGDQDIFTASSSGTTHFTIANDGNIGIGTSQPTGILQVTGDETRYGAGGTVNYADGDGDIYIQNDLEVDGTIYGAVVGTVAFSDITSGTNTQADMVVGSGATFKFNDDIPLTFGTDDDVTLQYDENGTNELQITGNTQFDNSVDVAGTLDVDNINLSGNTIAATNDSGINIYDNASNGITVEDGGYVGIGTTNPNSILDVAGTAFFNDNIYLNHNYENEDVALHFGNPTSGTDTLRLDNYDNDSSKFNDFNHTFSVSDDFFISGRLRTSSHGYFDGNVGIGTTNPLQNLQVGTLSNSVSGDGQLVFAKSNGSGAQRAFKMGLDSNYAFSLGDYGTSGSPSYSPYFTVKYQDGNVGIGTTTPDSLTHIYAGDSTASSFYGTEGLLIENDSHAKLEFITTNSDQQAIIFSDSDATEQGHVLYDHSTDVLQLASNGSATMYVDNGSVGIGSSSPAYNLDVSGTGRFTGNLDADNGLDVTGSSLTVGGSNATITTAGIIAGTQIFIDNLRMDANTFSSTTGDLSIDAAGGDINIGPSDDLNLTSSSDLFFGTTHLGETSGSTDSGAYVVGAFDEFEITDETNVQGVLDDLDQQISDLGSGSAGLWLDNTTYIYPSTADTDTRIYDNGDLAIGGTDFFVDDSAGNVGIGTSSPDYSLNILNNQNSNTLAHVDNPNTGNEAAAGGYFTSDSASAIFAAFSSTYDGGSAYGNALGHFADRVSFSAYDDAGGVDIVAAAASGDIRFYTGGNLQTNERLRIESGGNIGIGTTTTTETLDVNGSLGADTLNTGHGDNELYAMDQDVQTTDNVQFSDITSTGTLSVNTIRDYSGGDLVLQDDAGNVGIGTTGPSAELDIGGGTVNHIDGTDDVLVADDLEVDGTIYGDGSGITGISVSPAGSDGQIQYNNGGTMGGTSNLYYDDVNGYVGIGTTSPSSLLDVAGNVNIDGYATASASMALGPVNASEGVGHLDMAGNLTVSGTGTHSFAGTIDPNNIAAFTLTGKLTAGATEIEGSNFDINGGTVDSITSLTAANNLDIGAYELRAETFESDATTGTAPFTVASTTKVTNLNADLLDGYDWTDVPDGVDQWINESGDDMTGTLNFSGVTSDITTDTDEHLSLMPAGTGNVGIGTTTPGYKLELDGDMGLGSGHTIYDLDNTTYRIDPSGTNYFNIVSAAGRVNTNTIRDLSGGDIAIQDDAGNVGIGSTSPNAKLEIYGSSGTFLDVQDDGSSVFSVTDTQITSALPHQFTSTGDVSMAYDLIFTNQTSSQIESYGPFTIVAGESFESNDLTLKTYNAGDVVFDAAGGVTLAQAQDWDLASSTTALNFESGLLNLDTTNNRVGIGTTSPGVQLHATGDVRADNLLIDTSTVINDSALTLNDATRYLWTISSGWGSQWNTTDNSVEWYGSSTEVADLDLDNGNFQIDGTLSAAGGSDFSGDLTVTGDLYLGDRLYHNGDTDTYFDFNANAISLVAGGNYGMHIASDGNVGIGGTDANEQLDLNAGNIEANMLKDSSSPGTYWVDPGGGGPSGTGYSFVAANDIQLYGGGTIDTGGNYSITLDTGTASTEIIGGNSSTTLCITDSGSSSGTCDGKIDAGTVDPPYTINGKKFATYMAGMTGVKEETTGKITTTEQVPGVGYRKVIDFTQLEEGSDLWLFSKTAALHQHIEDLVALLTPAENTETWYKIDTKNYRLIIYSARPTEIAYRLTAPRFDADKWANQRDSGGSGHIVNDEEAMLALNNQGEIAIDETLAAITDTITIQEPVEYDGQLDKNSLNNFVYQLTNQAGQTIYNTASFAQAKIAQLQAGIVKTTNLIAERLNATSAKIAQLAADTITARQINTEEKLISPLIETENLIAKTVETEMIKPANDKDLMIELDASTKLEIKNTQGDTSFSIDSQGNATASGILESEALATNNIEAKQATVDGELTAKTGRFDKLYADSIEGLEARIATLASETINQYSFEEATPEDSKPDYSLTETATESALLADLEMGTWTATASGSYLDLAGLDAETGFFSDYLAVLGQATMTNLKVNNTINIDNSLQLTENSIGLAGTDNDTLYLQPAGSGGLDLMAGALTIDNNGDVNISGDLTIDGSLAANNLQTNNLKTETATASSSLFAKMIKPLPDQDLNIQLASRATESGAVDNSKLAFQNQLGDEVASVDASGSATFKKINIAAATATPSGSGFGQMIKPELKTNATAGEATLPANSQQIKIYNQNISKGTLIYITPASNTQNKVLYVKEKQVADNTEDSYFVVAIESEQALKKDIKFNWWIIN